MVNRLDFKSICYRALIEHFDILPDLVEVEFPDADFMAFSMRFGCLGMAELRITLDSGHDDAANGVEERINRQFKAASKDMKSAICSAPAIADNCTMH